MLFLLCINISIINLLTTANNGFGQYMANPRHHQMIGGQCCSHSGHRHKHIQPDNNNIHHYHPPPPSVQMSIDRQTIGKAQIISSPLLLSMVLWLRFVSKVQSIVNIAKQSHQLQMTIIAIMASINLQTFLLVLLVVVVLVLVVVIAIKLVLSIIPLMLIVLMMMQLLAT